MRSDRTGIIDGDEHSYWWWLMFQCRHCHGALEEVIETEQAAVHVLVHVLRSLEELRMANEALKAAVDANTTAVNAAVAFMEANAPDPVAEAALVAQITSSTNALNAAVANGTPPAAPEVLTQ